MKLFVVFIILEQNNLIENLIIKVIVDIHRIVVFHINKKVVKIKLYLVLPKNI